MGKRQRVLLGRGGGDEVQLGKLEAGQQEGIGMLKEDGKQGLWCFFLNKMGKPLKGFEAHK